MLAQLRDLLRLDLGAVDLRKGLTGLVAIIVFAVLVAILGDIGMVAAMAALFVIMADGPGPLRDRAVGVLIMTLFGSLIALVGIWAGAEHIWAATLLTFVVTAVATLAAGLGASAATRGLLLSIWAVLAISFAGDTDSAIQLAVAFTAGGIVAAFLIWLRSRVWPEPSVGADTSGASHTFDEIVHSSLGWFSLLRATAAALAMALGVWLFPDHAVWAALTVLLVMKPKAGEAVAAGLLRTIGTLLGVLAAEAVLGLSGGDDAILIVGFMVAAFSMTALKNVNYAIFVACLTAVLVLSQELVGASGYVAASDRLFATILGSVIAFMALGIGRWLIGRHIVGPSEADEDQTPG